MSSNAPTKDSPAATDVHRYSCLRRRSVRTSLPKMCSDLAAASTVSTESVGGKQSDLNGRLAKELLGANYACEASSDKRDFMKSALLNCITYVRTDGSVLESVNSSLNSADGTSLIVVKNPDNNGRRGCGGGDKQSAAAEDGCDPRQIASAAKLIATALLNHSQSSSVTTASASGAAHHDAHTARKAGRAVVADQQQTSSGPNGTDQDEAKAGGVIWSAATGLASGLASVVTGTVSYAFSAAAGDDDGDAEDYRDWDDAADYYDDNNNDKDDDLDGAALGVEYDDAAALSVDNNKRMIRGAVLLDEEKDEILNVGIVLDCVRMLLHHAESGIASRNDYHHERHSGQAKAVLLHRFGTNTSSLSEFFKRAAAEEQEKKGHSANAIFHASAQTLAKLSPSDMDMILLSMVSAGYAALSSDGDIVAILPQGGAAAATANKSTSPLNDVDVAIFRLRSTVSTLERRVEHLSDQANAVQDRSLKAKKQGKSALAVTYLKRRNLLRAEADKASSMLLNVENSLQSLERAKADAEVVKAYKLAGDAMKVARLSEEEGGLGLNADAVEKLIDDLADGNDDLEDISALIAADAGGSAGASGGGDIDEEELMKEIEELEVDMLADELASTSLEKKNIGSSSSSAVASVAQPEMESKDEVETNGKKEALFG